MSIREDFGFEGQGTVRGYARQRLSIPKRETRQERQPHRKEGHDALIDSLRDKNTYIRILTTSGEELLGRLNQSDRFTISFTVAGDKNPTIMFKHAIESFQLDVQEG